MLIHSFIHSLIVHSFNHSFIWLHCLTGILYEALECVTTCEAVHMTSGAECRQRRAAYSACFTPAAMSNYYSVFNQVTLTPGSHSHPAHVLLLYTEVTLTPGSCITTLHCWCSVVMGCTLKYRVDTLMVCCINKYYCCQTTVLIVGQSKHKFTFRTLYYCSRTVVVKPSCSARTWLLSVICHWDCWEWDGN